jgi:hypothetical protein
VNARVPIPLLRAVEEKNLGEIVLWLVKYHAVKWKFSAIIIDLGGTRGSVVDWGTMQKARRSAGSVHDEVIDFVLSP